jgi:hypothetical protein
MNSHLGVVIHVTAGEASPYNEFVNLANQVSSHFGIMNGRGGTTDGHIEQYVDCDLASYAQENGNYDYISVETEGVPTEPLTDSQIVSFARIYVWLNQTYGIPFVVVDSPGQRGIINHSDGGLSWGGHPCPGDIRSAQRQKIVDLAKGLINPVPPIPIGVDMSDNLVADANGGVWAVDPNNHLHYVSRQPADPSGFSDVDVTSDISNHYPNAKGVITVRTT